MDIDKIIDKLFNIVTELDARNLTHNCVISEFNGTSWDDLCDKGINLLKKLKENEEGEQ